MSTVAKSLPALEVLKTHPQWVCFNKGKMPFTPSSGKAAKASIPDTWGTFQEAVKAQKSNPSWYKGVGYETVKEQGITVGDVDHCIDENGIISAYGQHIIQVMDTYFERSPSGRGLRFIAYGTIPSNLGADIECDGDERLEMKDHGGFYTITGNHLEGTPTTIEDRQEQLLALYEEKRETRRKTKEQKYKQQPIPTKDTPSFGSTPYGLKALADEAGELASCGEGGRNQRLNNAAYNLGRLIAGNELAQSEVERTLIDACQRNGLLSDDGERSVQATIRSGITKGLLSPRSAPIKPEFIPYVPTPMASNGNGNHAKSTPPALPSIITGGQMRDAIDASLAALKLAEQDTPTIFVQSAQLVKVCRNEKNQPIIVTVSEPSLREMLTRSANFFRTRKEGDAMVLIPISPPKELAESILHTTPDKWPFYPLDAIVETPVLRPDGSILDVPGYDRATGLYYFPKIGMHMPAIPAYPTQYDAEQAAVYINGFITDFPFVSDADTANAIGLFATSVIRHLVRHVPCALINGTKAGTGKGLLTDATAIIATGRTSSSISQVESDEEWDKRITAMLMNGATFISIDNVEGVLRSSALSKVLTSDSHQGRVLGVSKMVNVPQRATWVVNGNNIQLGGDMARRCFPINLAVQVSDPWTREDFKYPNLIASVENERGKIIAALLTMVRAWIVAGKPAPQHKAGKLATFSEWVDVIAGMLSYAGVSGFLDNLSEMHAKSDVDSKAWARFLETWYSKFGKEEFTVKELLVKLDGDSDFADTLPEPMATWRQEQVKSLSNKVGKQLSKKNGTPFGFDNLRIVQGESTHSKVATYKVAGYAGYAGYKSSLRVDETEILCKDAHVNDSGVGAKITPHTPHTPQDTPEKGLGRRCTDCKRNEAVVWWKGDVPRCRACQDKANEKAE